ncbi:hypothetical protein BDZ94DRAFT_1258838 [Collybia nuda]|uniref:Uncharacterized protein n=1 Tax=Collybia nuda TaxID=64659 RepID=A0A9P6CF12_9AGAR|nr:hypothetical protein BDZ94DRAFT_1258838 [Collybia nuda]
MTLLHGQLQYYGLGLTYITRCGAKSRAHHHDRIPSYRPRPIRRWARCKDYRRSKCTRGALDYTHHRKSDSRYRTPPQGAQKPFSPSAGPLNWSRRCARASSPHAPHASPNPAPTRRGVCVCVCVCVCTESQDNAVIESPRRITERGAHIEKSAREEARK